MTPPYDMQKSWVKKQVIFHAQLQNRHAKFGATNGVIDQAVCRRVPPAGAAAPIGRSKLDRRLHDIRVEAANTD